MYFNVERNIRFQLQRDIEDLRSQNETMKNTISSLNSELKISEAKITALNNAQHTLHKQQALSQTPGATLTLPAHNLNSSSTKNYFNQNLLLLFIAILVNSTASVTPDHSAYATPKLTPRSPLDDDPLDLNNAGDRRSPVSLKRENRNPSSGDLTRILNEHLLTDAPKIAVQAEHSRMRSVYYLYLLLIVRLLNLFLAYSCDIASSVQTCRRSTSGRQAFRFH